MIKLYPTRAFKALLTLTVASFSVLSLSAQCPSGSVPAVSGATYNNGQVVCVSSDFAGNINLNSGSQLIITSGGSYKGHISAASNVQIYIQKNATFKPGQVNNFSGTITNYGTADINFTFNGNVTVINANALTIGNNVNYNGTLTVTNTACGTLSFAKDFKLNSGSNAITNRGAIVIPGDFSLGQGNQLTNFGKIYVSGAATLVGKITNDGYLVFKGGSHTLQGNDSLINKNVVVLAGSATIEKAIRNEGLFWVTGSTTFQNSNNFNETNPTALLRIDGSMSNFGRIIGGAGQGYIAGAYVNYNGGQLLLNMTTTKKDTINYVATMATPVKMCGSEESQLPLPIVLQNFNAKASGNAAQLNWSTVSELNGKAMIVQHSTDGVNFEDIQTVASTTNSSLVQNYSYIDNNVANGVNYYRLKLVSSDAPISYSAVVAVKFNTTTEQQAISVFPNPFSDHFTVKFADVKGGNVVAKLFSAQGAVILVQSFNSAASVTINTPASLAKGVYVLEISANGEKYYHRLMKL